MPASPMDKSTKVALLVIAALLLMIGLPLNDAFSIGKYKARDITCKANLHQIGLAVLSYRAAHRNQMPSGLKSLAPILGSQSVFVCPITGFNDTPPYTERSYTYRYLKQPRSGDIICWDSGTHQPDHSVFIWLNRECRNVLYADGRVGTVSEARFDSLGLRGACLTISPQ